MQECAEIRQATKITPEAAAGLAPLLENTGQPLPKIANNSQYLQTMVRAFLLPINCYALFAMQHLDALHPSYIESDGSANGIDEIEALVVLEWAVPTAAKVPAPRQRASVATITIRPASITTTVPAKIITELRANNTVLPTRWCTTATLTASPRAPRARLSR